MRVNKKLFINDEIGRIEVRENSKKLFINNEVARIEINEIRTIF